MEILWSVVAVVAGFVVMAVVVMISSIAAAKVFDLPLRPAADAPAPAPSRPYLAVNLTTGLIAAIVGGAVTGCLAHRNIMLHAMALALLVAGMGVLSARTPQPGQPAWYGLIITAIGAVGALIGGWLCTRGL